MARRYIGTEELVGAKVLRVEWDEMVLSKDGRELVLSLEYSEDYDSFCESACSCCYASSPSGYFRAEETV
jgi:hypothetical protein